MKIIILSLLFFTFGAALADPIIKISVSVYPYYDAPELQQELLKACRSELETIDDIELVENACDADYMIKIEVLEGVIGLRRNNYAFSMTLAAPNSSRDGSIISTVHPALYDRSLYVTDSLAEYCHNEIGRINQDWMQLLFRDKSESDESQRSADAVCH